MIATIVSLHAFATLSMVGVIWFVQVVHYPLMAHVSLDAFPRFEREHQRRTTWVVAPLMLLEASTACLLLVLASPLSLGVVWLGIALLTVLWLATFFWQVPLHSRLAARFNVNDLRRLVRSNWLRTMLWTVRGGLAIWMLNTV